MHLELRIITWLVTSCIATHAFADSDDLITVNLASTYTYDSNLFRLSDGASSSSIKSRRDGLISGTAAVSLHKRYSMQEFTLDYSHIENKYQNNSYLNFNTNNYSGKWFFMITPDLSGTLNIYKNQMAAGFRDTSNYSKQTIITSENKSLDFDYSPFNNWHLLLKYSRVSSKNSQTFNDQPAFEVDSLQLGASYVFSSGASFKMTTQNGDGNYTENVDTTLSGDRAYKDSQQEMTLVLPVTLQSNLSTNLGYVQRENNTSSLRDYSGLFGGATYTWRATPKLTVVTALSRKIANNQLIDSSYSSIDSLSVGPIWQISEKLDVGLNAGIGVRNYKGAGTLQSNSSRKDNTQSIGLNINWMPRDKLRFNALLQHQSRQSTSTGFDYDDNSATVGANFSF